MEIEQLKEKFLKLNFDEREFLVDGDAIVGFSLACGETAPRFTDPSHPDFQAPPTFPARFHGRRMLPMDLSLGGKLPLDAGKAVMPKKPIRAGTKLLGRSHLHDIYEKTGRSGGMLFIVHRMTFTNQNEEPISIVDWRLVQNQVSQKTPQEAGQT